MLEDELGKRCFKNLKTNILGKVTHFAHESLFAIPLDETAFSDFCISHANDLDTERLGRHHDIIKLEIGFNDYVQIYIFSGPLIYISNGATKQFVFYISSVSPHHR